jgi:enoyl-CoA hydratase/carnithine racemase
MLQKSPYVNGDARRLTSTHAACQIPCEMATLKSFLADQMSAAEALRLGLLELPDHDPFDLECRNPRIFEETTPFHETLAQSIAEALRPDPPQQKPSTGGAPRKVSDDVMLKASAWLAAEGIPERLAEVERKLHELMDKAGRTAGEATIRRYAQRLVELHKQALDEA